MSRRDPHPTREQLRAGGKYDHAIGRYYPPNRDATIRYCRVANDAAGEDISTEFVEYDIGLDELYLDGR